MILSGLLLAILLLILSLCGIYLDAEHVGFNASGTIGSSPVGHMSPVTAICFLFIGMAALFVFYSHSRRFVHWASMGSAGIALMIASFFLVPYIGGTPLLYEAAIIPPSISVLISFVLLSAGIILSDINEIAHMEEMHGKRTVRTIFPLLLSLFLFTMLIFTLGYSYLTKFIRQHRSEVEVQLELVTRLKAKQLADFISERFGDIITFQGNPLFVRLVSDVISDPFSNENVGQLTTWLNNFRVAYRYKRICLLDDAGRLILKVPDSGEPVSQILISKADEVRDTREPAFIEIYQDSVTLRIGSAFLAPICQDGNPQRTEAVMVLEVDLSRFLFPLLVWWPTQSVTAETVIVTSDSMGIRTINPSAADSGASPLLDFPSPDTECTCTKAASGQLGAFTGTDCEGVPVLAYAATVPGTGYLVITRLDMHEVSSPVRERLWNLILLMCVTVVMTIILLGLIWRNQRVIFYKNQVMAERALREIETRHRLLVEFSNDAILLTTPDGRILNANPASCRIFGYTLEEIRQLGRSGVVDPGDPRLDTALRTREREGSFHGELTLLKKGNIPFEAEISSTLFSTEEGEFRTSMIVRDITERKHMEDSIRMSEARFRGFFENVTNYCYMVSPEGLIMDVNSSALAVLGYGSKEELIGKPVLETIYAPDDRERARTLFATWRETGLLRDEEIRIVTAAGKERIVLLNANSIRNEAGDIIHSVSIQTDVTELKKAEMELRKEMKRLQLMNESMVDRELQMVRLKKEIEELKREIREGNG